MTSPRRSSRQAKPRRGEVRTTMHRADKVIQTPDTDAVKRAVVPARGVGGPPQPTTSARGGAHSCQDAGPRPPGGGRSPRRRASSAAVSGAPPQCRHRASPSRISRPHAAHQRGSRSSGSGLSVTTPSPSRLRTSRRTPGARPIRVMRPTGTLCVSADRAQPAYRVPVGVSEIDSWRHHAHREDVARHCAGCHRTAACLVLRGWAQSTDAFPRERRCG